MKSPIKSLRHATMITLASLTLALPYPVYAHCDTLEGPVVKTARQALEEKTLAPVLKWVRAEDEAEIKTAFNHTLKMRSLNAEAAHFADQYFFETLVRVHRAGEGMPYTGLKPASEIDPAVVLADKALADGSVDTLVTTLSRAMETGLRQRFEQARETQMHAEHTTTAGRTFVADYVNYTHFVEGLHSLIQNSATHAPSATPAASAHAH